MTALLPTPARVVLLFTVAYTRTSLLFTPLKLVVGTSALEISWVTLPEVPP